jgi:dimethylhistidine N-methyltransferase
MHFQTPCATPVLTATAAEIIDGLCQRPPRISPKYFYDQHGSELFEAITRLPEYYPTRTEQALMHTHGEAIARAVGTACTVIEPGAGNCEKAHALCQRIAPAAFVGIDISADFLQGAVQRLRSAYPGLWVRAVAGDITHGVALPTDVPRQRRLVFYPGSSIGNFDPPQAIALLAHMRDLMDDDGGLLIGIDLPKQRPVLEAAYDDAQGVTAAFNRNVLRHINRLIGSNFEPSQWAHRAFFNDEASRIEMHLEALAPTNVVWHGGERSFAAGERIHTENSYKHSLPVFQQMLAQAGFSRAQAWTDAQGWFAVVYAQP